MTVCIELHKVRYLLTHVKTLSCWFFCTGIVVAVYLFLLAVTDINCYVFFNIVFLTLHIGAYHTTIERILVKNNKCRL